MCINAFGLGAINIWLCFVGTFQALSQVGNSMMGCEVALQGWGLEFEDGACGEWGTFFYYCSNNEWICIGVCFIIFGLGPKLSASMGFVTSKSALLFVGALFW